MEKNVLNVISTNQLMMIKKNVGHLQPQNLHQMELYVKDLNLVMKVLVIIVIQGSILQMEKNVLIVIVIPALIVMMRGYALEIVKLDIINQKLKIINVLIVIVIPALIVMMRGYALEIVKLDIINQKLKIINVLNVISTNQLMMIKKNVGHLQPQNLHQMELYVKDLNLVMKVLVIIVIQGSILQMEKNVLIVIVIPALIVMMRGYALEIVKLDIINQKLKIINVLNVISTNQLMMIKKNVGHLQPQNLHQMELYVKDLNLVMKVLVIIVIQGSILQMEKNVLIVIVIPMIIVMMKGYALKIAKVDIINQKLKVINVLKNVLLHAQAVIHTIVAIYVKMDLK